ncbi:MAG: FAD-binding oxidoreductase [Ignavibacteria bacterium]|jgi:D-lactate dehydrogenase (cytochrome)|nr:FAD-binding oxidoreductase [Ignavibacteria bacterium]MDH7526884.1 FAD-binding oxidoreductase [Ignavibacteria bacterium]NPV11722.1 FAD-binding oxidoreductase [Ignavibacteria bacterium]
MIVKTDQETIQNYLTDASNFKSNGCEAVYIPENIDELSELIKKFNNEKIPVTISGAGTGLVGGRVPSGGVVVSLEKFNQIISLDEDKKLISVQSFVTLNELQNFLNDYKLFYPPDPTERNCSTGGTIATNASGARTLKYGSTRKWVNAILLILPDGELFRIQRNEIKADGYEFNFSISSGKKYNFRIPEIAIPKVKNAAGYFFEKDMDLIDLFIGSEGTLGIIVETELKLLIQPNDLISMVIFFESFDDAYRFVDISRKINKDEKYNLINPRALEFFDDQALKFLAKKFPNVDGKKFAIWFEQEIYNENKDEIISQLSDLILECSGNIENIWFAFNEKEVNDIREFRHSISALVNEYISRNDLKKVGTDIAVPSNYFREFYYFCCESCKSNAIDYVGYGHIGNDHLHFNMLPKDKAQNELALNLYREFCKKAVQLGGTISAEHGIGKLKRQFFELMYPEDVLRKMFEIKKIFDPNLILNRGNIFPERFFK